MAEGGWVVLVLPEKEEFDLLAGLVRKAGLRAISWEGGPRPGESLEGEDTLFVLDTRMGRPNAYEWALALRGKARTKVLLLADRSMEKAARSLATFAGAAVLFRPFRAEDFLACLGEEGPGRVRPSTEGLLREREATLDREVFSKRVLEGLSGWEDSTQELVQSLMDPQTGLFHQGFMKLRLEEEVKRARRFHQVLTLVLLRLEAPPGWSGPPPLELLLSLSGRLLSETRDIDLLGRWGEESLALLLPGTPPEGAAAMVRRVFPDARELLARSGGWKAPVGIAQAPSPGVDRGRDLLARALQALEEARTSLTSEDLVGLSGPAG